MVRLKALLSKLLAICIVVVFGFYRIWCSVFCPDLFSSLWIIYFNLSELVATIDDYNKLSLGTGSLLFSQRSQNYHNMHRLSNDKGWPCWYIYLFIPLFVVLHFITQMARKIVTQMARKMAWSLIVVTYFMRENNMKILHHFARYNRCTHFPKTLSIVWTSRISKFKTNIVLLGREKNGTATSNAAPPTGSFLYTCVPGIA